MFTGIITDIATIKQIDKRSNGISLIVETSYDTASIELGCSIAHDGVCLTVTQIFDTSYAVDISEETLQCTNLGSWVEGDKINLERALRIGDELGGHMVSGHVDKVGSVENIKQIGDNKKLTFTIPQAIKKYIVAKGSVTINGVSLTVNDVDNSLFCVNLIAHSLQNTTLDGLSIGDEVNIEIDMFARYCLA